MNSHIKTSEIVSRYRILQISYLFFVPTDGAVYQETTVQQRATQSKWGSMYFRDNSVTIAREDLILFSTDA